jgi:TRAP-type C4-dicarboxylate transport system permease small subunit
MLQVKEETRQSRLVTFDNWLHGSLGIACGILLVGLVTICFVEVLLRDLVSKSLPWYDELAGFLLVWLTFLGAALAEQRNGHIGVELIERLGPRRERAFRGVNQLVLFGMQALILYHGVILAVRSADTMAITLPISMGILYAIVPVWSVLMMIIHAMHLTRLVRRDAR